MFSHQGLHSAANFALPVSINLDCLNQAKRTGRKNGNVDKSIIHGPLDYLSLLY